MLQAYHILRNADAEGISHTYICRCCMPIICLLKIVFSKCHAVVLCKKQYPRRNQLKSIDKTKQGTPLGQREIYKICKHMKTNRTDPIEHRGELELSGKTNSSSLLQRTGSLGSLIQQS